LFSSVLLLLFVSTCWRCLALDTAIYSYSWSLAASRQASEEACRFLLNLLKTTFTSNATKTLISRHVDCGSSGHSSQSSFLYQSSEIVQIGMRTLLRLDLQRLHEDQNIAGKTPQQFI
ncbi:hypothetical protein CSUI_010791, partial [Cystoisospora suis]